LLKRRNPKKKTKKKTKKKVAKAKKQSNATRPPGDFVTKNSWWYATCPKHGEQPHLSYIGGRCERCQAEKFATLDKNYKPTRTPIRRPYLRRNASALWNKTKKVASESLKRTGRLMPGYMDPRAIRMFGSWALDYAIPREVRAEFLRELDANLNLGRSECLDNFGEEHCQKVEAAAISLGKKWAATNRKIEEAIGRDGQFDAWLDVFNSELEAAKAKKQPAVLRGNPWRRNTDWDVGGRGPDESLRRLERTYMQDPSEENRQILNVFRLRIGMSKVYSVEQLEDERNNTQGNY
jgi:hypothetical protein